MSDPEPSPSSSAPRSGVGQSLDRAADKTRRFTPAMFAIVAVCFFLPFVTVSCGGQALLTLSGLDFVFGTEVELEQDLQEAFPFDDLGDLGTSEEETPVEIEAAVEDDRVESNVFAIVALAAAIAGIVLALVLRNRVRSLAAAIAAGVVIVSLIGLRFDLDLDVDTGEIPGVVSVDYRFGYWIALLVAAVIVVTHVVELRRATRPAAEPPPAGGSPPAPGSRPAPGPPPAPD